MFPALNENELNKMSTLAIAQVGDAVYELMVRTKLCSESSHTAKSLHNSRVALVNAVKQAQMTKQILEYLTNEEAAYYMRGRNAKAGGIPKAATRGEYGAATALETLMGWLWLTGKTDRLKELFEVIMNGQGQ